MNIDLDRELIEYKIKKRSEIYFLVTESDLNEIKSKSNYTDWSFLLTSIFLGALVSIIITLVYGIDLKPEAKSILYTLLWVFAFLSLGLIILTIIFHLERKKVISKIKGKKDISIQQVDKYFEQPNPEKFKGNKKLILNIDLKQKQIFLETIKNHPLLSLLKSSDHSNKLKKDYFTFILENVNDELNDYFKKFLNEHSINYIDYGFN